MLGFWDTDAPAHAVGPSVPPPPAAHPGGVAASRTRAGVCYLGGVEGQDPRTLCSRTRPAGLDSWALLWRKRCRCQPSAWGLQRIKGQGEAA